MRALRVLLLPLLVPLVTACSEDADDTGGPLGVSPPALAEGIDFGLPPTVEPHPYSGWFRQGNVSEHQSIRHVGQTYTWAETNPAQGVFDFSPLEDDLALAEQEQRGIVARLKCSVVWRDSPWDDPIPFIPQWVLDLCDPPRFMTAADIEVAVPWDACVQSHYRAFVEQFGTTGLLAHSWLMGLYVHAISSSFGEEAWLTEEAIAAGEQAGMTHEAYRQAFMDRIDWWSAAAGSNAYKLAWVGGGVSPAYRQDATANNEHAVEQGLGWRGGGLEVFHTHTDPQVGVSFEETSAGQWHLRADPAFPVRAEGRYFGEEIEIYDPFPADTRPLMFTSSVMRAVQLGLNFLWTSDDAASLALDWVEWFTLVAGKRASTTPEAVCWLREDYLMRGSDAYEWHNYESYLVQRDVTGGTSRPVLPVERPAWWMDWPDQHYDYTARATEAAAGQRFLAFFLDDTFRETTEGPVQLKVIFLDDSTARWQLLAGGADGAMAGSAMVQGLGDGAWRTATFELSTVPHPGAFETDEDFRLQVEGDADLTVRFVRVVR